MTDKSHLLRFGYAPGNYWFVCQDCEDKQAVGDKRATRCEACAETLYSQVTSVEAVADKHRAMTTVPEEAVKAMPERIYAVKQTEGSNCVVSFDTPSLDYNVEYVRADLALPHLPQGVGVKVKPLDWMDDSAPGYRLFSAQSDIGHFAYGTDADGNPWSSSPLGIKDHANEETAKRAAERAHHELVVDQAKAIGLEVSALEPSSAACPCTLIQQDETCPVGYPSLLCEICGGKGVLQPSAAREQALEEILREVDEIERKAFAWSGSAFLNNELEGADDADCKTELYSELCGIGNTMHWLRTKICALSSTDHADAGKVEGGHLPQDVINLVIAAREAFDTGVIPEDEEYNLDKALEPFGERVPYENEPDPLPSAPSQEVAGS